MDDVKDALIAVGIEGMTASEVKGPSFMTTLGCENPCSQPKLPKTASLV